MECPSRLGILVLKNNLNSKTMELKSLFKKNPNIIINTDIDGILSGIILCKYCNCNIVGFTNSKDKVWLADGYDDLYKHIYIDIFVTNDETICIDQHVVAVTDEHMQQIRNLNNKFSPQCDDPKNLRIFSTSGFKYKYPFGTFQYLVAQLESEGVKIKLPNLNTKIPKSNIKLGDLLHRADDAMKTSLFAYERNADFWWNWLEAKAPNGSIKILKKYLDELGNACDSILNDGTKHQKDDYKENRKKIVEKIKLDTKEYFKNQFLCKSSDGGFNNITDDKNTILPNIEKYIKTISKLLQFGNITIPTHYNVHKGKDYRTRWIDLFEDEFLKNYTIYGHKVFSYAFIYGPDNDGQTNFSFTVDMN